VERVSGKVEARLLERELDDSLRRRVVRTIDEVFATLPAEAAATLGATADEIKEAARAELLELGPLSQLLDDPAVSEFTVSGAGYLNVVRAGHYHDGILPFCSARSVERALARLCRQEGVPLGEEETVVKRQFVSLGFDLEALRGEVAQGGALVRLKRRERVTTKLEDLVRAGVVSRSMATFLRDCVSARASVLVVGGRRSGAVEMLSALAQAAENERVLFIQDESEIATANGSVLTLGTGRAQQLSEILVAAVGFSGHRIVVDAMQGERALATLRAIAEGAEGTIARIRGGSIERACARVCADLGLGTSGMTSRAVADAMIASFDVAIEVARLRDGRSRVLRICELHRGPEGQVAAESVFDFVAERTATGGAIEGSFRATGRSPQLADEIRSRGNRLDAALFVRPPSSN
jgi:pilus assembly protein CpaF